MADPGGDLIEQTKRLLAPGEIDLLGLIVETDLGRDEELEMIDRTIELGETIADHLTDDATYIYSGVADPAFSTNQHQCLTVEGDAFVWECQQLLREGTFDLVFYYEASPAHHRVLDTLLAAGHAVTEVVPD